MFNQLMDKICNREVNVAVVGLGYVGLPLAIEIANKGFKVFGIDVIESKLNLLNNGMSYIIDVEDQDICSVINRFLFTEKDFSVLSDANAIIICVPTPLNKYKAPDLSYINSVVKEIKQYIKKGTLIILESTTYPGSTEELIIEVLEKELGFIVGKDFFVCFSPERIDPSNKEFNIKNTPKVIGGKTTKCLNLGVALYETFIDTVIPVNSIEVAEMTKLLENTFRSINIGFINEFTMICDSMGINIWEVIKAASTKPYGFMPFYPGSGIGGHCLPIDPIYLSWKAKQYNFNSRFIEITTDINMNMPRYVVDDITDILNLHEKPIKNSEILIFGVSYKKDVSDVRESPAVEVIDLLIKKGARLSYFDPYVETLSFENYKLNSINLTIENIKKADIVVILTDHSKIDYKIIIENAKLIYDTKNIIVDYENNTRMYLLGGKN